MDETEVNAVRRFYEDYQRERSGGAGRAGPPVIRKNAGTAVVGFFTGSITAVLCLAATILSSVGLTVLINKPLRDMLFAFARSVFTGD